MQFLQRLSISWQIRFSLVGVVIFGLPTVAAVLVFLSYQAQLELVVSLQKERSRSAVYEVTIYLDGLKQKLTFLSRMRGLTKLDANTQRDLLVSLSRQNDAFEALALLNAAGDTVSFHSLLDRTLPEDLGKQHNFIRPMYRGEEFVGSVTINRDLRQPEVLISVPVRDRQDHVDGVLVALINLRFLWLMVDSTRVGRTGTIYIVDKYNNLIAKHGADQIQFQPRNLTGESFFRYLTSESYDSQKSYIGIDGVPVFGIIRLIPEIGWYLAIELPVDEVYAPIRNMIYVMSVALVLILLVAILLGAGFARRIVQPLQKLTTVAKEISAGNLGLQAEVSAKNELGVLANAFNQMTTKLQMSAEMQMILAKVDEGLFLLTPQGDRILIGKQHSLALKRMLETNDPSGMSLPSILNGRLSEARLESIGIFLRLMFDTNMDAEMLAELNPLREIKLSGHGDDPSDNRYLEFQFSRIMEGGEVFSLLAAIKDVTAPTLLAFKLQETEEESQDWMSLLFQALHCNPHLLLDFMIGFQNELQEMTSILSNIQENSLSQQELDDIYRYAHSIKGNAGLLQLKAIVDRTHELEDSIEQCKESLGADMLAQSKSLLFLSECYEALEGMYGKLDDILSHLQSFQKVLSEDATDLVVVFLETIKSAIRRLSLGLEKQVDFDSSAFPSFSLSFGARKVLMETLLQLVRNAVAHGIELPEERAEKGKSQVGRIELRGTLSGDRLEVRLRDDGRGVQVERLREVAREAGYWQAPKLLEDEHVLDLIFAPGISTAQEVSTNAGRGMGMDMVRRKLEESGGSIAVESVPGQFCEFVISLPSDTVENSGNKIS